MVCHLEKWGDRQKIGWHASEKFIKPSLLSCWNEAHKHFRCVRPQPKQRARAYRDRLLAGLAVFSDPKPWQLQQVFGASGHIKKICPLYCVLQVNYWRIS